jgi:hypothetical protein
MAQAATLRTLLQSGHDMLTDRPLDMGSVVFLSWCTSVSVINTGFSFRHPSDPVPPRAWALSNLMRP